MAELNTNRFWACRLTATLNKKTEKISKQTFTTLPENVGLSKT